ncbi:MAG TPA: OB-fold domain-containing protein [Acidimicrobiales bacterium]|nr:OB-fold domain-containing protein [Acidimicrobiales bacterium]
MDRGAEEVLSDAHVLEYPYSRSLGPVLGAFFTGLRDGVILAGRSPSGTVIVPPTEYDPQTSEPVDELVEVGPQGRVETWAWVARPLPQHPLAAPFAWALITPEGASTSMLHVVDAGSPEVMRHGLAVVADWVPADERVGRIQDIRAFVPAEDR